MTWVKRTIWQNKDGSFKAADDADVNHVAHDAIELTHDPRLAPTGTVVLAYSGKEVRVWPDHDPLVLRDELEKPAKKSPEPKKAPKPTPRPVQKKQPTPAPKAKKARTPKRK